jgi:hypothetical protein
MNSFSSHVDNQLSASDRRGKTALMELMDELTRYRAEQRKGRNKKVLGEHDDEDYGGTVSAWYQRIFNRWIACAVNSNKWLEVVERRLICKIECGDDGCGFVLYCEDEKGRREG